MGLHLCVFRVTGRIPQRLKMAVGRKKVKEQQQLDDVEQTLHRGPHVPLSETTTKDVPEVTWNCQHFSAPDYDFKDDEFSV